VTLKITCRGSFLFACLAASLYFSVYASPQGGKKMALIDSIEKHTVKSESKCTLAIILEMLGEKDRTDLLSHITKGTPTSTLTSALRSEGYQIAEATFQKHRNGQCKCPVIE
jgi:hypothetical protein